MRPKQRSKSKHLGTSDPQNCEVINVCHCKLLNLWYSHMAAIETHKKKAMGFCRRDDKLKSRMDMGREAVVVMTLDLDEMVFKFSCHLLAEWFCYLGDHTFITVDFLLYKLEITTASPALAHSEA